jgi:hypothetical protein
MTVKTGIFSFIVVFCITFCITGCSSGPRVVTYSFAEVEGETVTITFGDNVRFLAFDGKELPKPEPGTHWAPGIIFPAGIPLTTTVHVFYDGRDHYFWTGAALAIGNEGALLVLPFTLARDILWSPVVFVDFATAKSQATNRDVIFLCPALVEGRKYNVYFKRKGKKYLLFVKDTGSNRVIYEQQFERIQEMNQEINQEIIRE